MKINLLTLLFLFTSLAMKSQTLSQAEARALADKLHEVEILSQKGSQLLKENLNQDAYRKSEILRKLGDAFIADLYYRSGILEQQKLADAQKKARGNTAASKEERRAIKKEWKAMLPNLEGYKIEAAIEDEENFPPEAKSYSMPLLGMPRDIVPKQIHPKRSVMGKTCTRTLKDLLKINLIDTVVYEELEVMLKNNQLVMEVLVITQAHKRTVYYENFQQNKSKELDLIQRLNAKGLISDDNLKKLSESDSDIALLAKYELLQYCDKSRIFHLDQYSNDLSIGFKAIFEDIKNILPDLQFEKFTTTTFPVESYAGDDLIEHHARISFEVNGTVYSHSFFYDFVRKNPEEEKRDENPFLNISSEFHKGVNKFLVDQGSEYRLYYANKKEAGKGVYGKEEFGLILMTKEQYEAWDSHAGDYFLSIESYDNTFSSANIQAIIADYERIGLFSHLSAEERGKAREAVLNAEIASYSDILLCFPKTIVYFDWETGNLENPYEELTQKLGEASRGVFTPINIVDQFEESWGKTSVPYSFEFNNNLYKAELKMQSDWLDPDFMDIIDKALKEQQVDGDYQYCLNDGQASGYIFLTKAQQEFISKNQEGFFPKYH